MVSSRLKCLRNVLFRFYPNVHIIFLCTGISFVFYSVLYKDIFLFDGTYFVNISVRSRHIARNQARSKLILLYTPFFGEKWPDYTTLEQDRLLFVEGHTTFQDCEVSTCAVTYNRSKLLHADAVGFHGRDMPNVLPSRPTPQQIWFYYVLENPLNVFMDEDGYADVFNWTMSYSRESEIYTPYGMYSSLKENSKDSDNHEQIKQDKHVAWLVSNCNAIERRKYVNELQNYISVSIYGECGDSESCPRERHSPICNALLRRHKFYLAFENGNCPDYITEKYWENAIDNNIVPVVMGGADYKTLAIPNSYIDVQDFASPKELAEYLLYLEGNDTAYREYFTWKKRYQRIIPHRACILCKQLHNQSLHKPQRVYRDMGRFWDRKQCRKLNLTN